MDRPVGHDVDEDQAGSAVDRRKFIQRAGAGTVVAGGILAAPAIIGSNVAFAQGSVGGGGGDDDDLLPPDAAPDEDLCGEIQWAATSNNPGVNGTAHLVAFPKASTNSGVALTGVTSTLVGGASAPSTLNPQIATGTPTSFHFRNLGANQRAFQGQGSITASGPVGLVFVQHNTNGGNTSPSSIVNYQQVTFQFNTVIQNLRFTIHDLSASTVDGNSQGVDTIVPYSAGPPANNGALYSGAYRDAIGFNRPITVTPGNIGDASNTVDLAGTGTYSNPLRRSAISFWPGSGTQHRNVQITMPGPLSSFTMRYSTIGGWGTQWISLSNMKFGLCP